MEEALVHGELLAACSSLGYSDGTHYHREADCLETTKDLLRYLRRDDDGHGVRCALGEARVLQTDLLPLLQEHGEDEELLQLVVRLMMDLTNPAFLLFRQELPEEKRTRRQFLQLVRYQQGYKEAFVNQRAWEALATRLAALLEVPREERDEDARLLLERLLVLVRNVLWVPASPEEGRTDDDASVHDQVLWAMHLSGMAELLLYLAACPAEHDFSLHLLEIVSLMLREQDAALLATTSLHGSHQEKEEDNRRLEELRRQEALRREAGRRASAGRHPRFGGTYVVRQVKGVGDRDLVLHRPLTGPTDISYDRNKRPRKYTKQRFPLQEVAPARRSTLAVRVFLQELCAEFLAGAYNGVMAAVRDSLDRARAQDDDETHYLWAVRFFMEFNRRHGFRPELVTETLGVETFHFVQTHVEKCWEMMTAEKKKVTRWSWRMHGALRAYQELLATLAHMDASPSREVRESSRVLKSRLFYVPEYREMPLLLLQNYDPAKMSLGFLRDTVETTHVFLKLLQGMCRQGRHVLVQGRARRPPRRKPKAAAAVGSTEQSPERLLELWEEASAEVAAAVQIDPQALPDAIPFDALSEEPQAVQRELAMRRIGKHLRDGELPRAVSLLRAAREVWPEGDIFGPQESDHTQDFLTLREIFMANLSHPEETPAEEEERHHEEEEEEEEEEERTPVMSEQEFDFDAFVRRFANTKVVRAYGRLLHHYQTNSSHTNHCILKLFHRLAWDCKLPAVFFQASLFLVFLRAMEDPQRDAGHSSREIARFGKHVMRRLYRVADTNPKVVVEMLFWKTNREALEIECGYGEQEEGERAARRAWGEEEEEELRTLHGEAEKIPTEERGGKDVVDLILERLIRRDRTRRSVIKKLKELGLIGNPKDLKRRTPRISAPRTWTEEEEEELRRLFQENKEALDVVGRIMDNSTLRRPKHRVVEKMLELGLVQDRKELRKKRAKTTKPKRSSGQDFLTANQTSDDEGSDDEGTESENDYDDATTILPPPPPPAVPVATPALISEGLDVVLAEGRREAVDWLARVMADVADDREEDGDFEPVPILAITPACTEAMEDEAFHKLLRLVGLQPPLTHQEMFWRVPARLTVAGLRKRASYLRQGANEGLRDVENPNEPLDPPEVVPPKTMSHNKEKKKPKKTRKSKSETRKRTSRNRDDGESSVDERPVSSRLLTADGDSNDDGDDNDDAPLSSLAASSSSRVRKRMLSDDDDDDDDVDGDDGEEKLRKRTGKKRLVVDSDSEEEEERKGEREEEEKEEEEEEQEEPSSSRKKQRIKTVIDSDDE